MKHRTLTLPDYLRSIADDYQKGRISTEDAALLLKHCTDWAERGGYPSDFLSEYGAEVIGRGGFHTR